MKKCRTCGRAVEGNFGYHLDKCYVKPIVREFYGTSLYNIVKRLYPEMSYAKTAVVSLGVVLLNDGMMMEIQ